MGFGVEHPSGWLPNRRMPEAVVSGSAAEPAGRRLRRAQGGLPRAGRHLGEHARAIGGDGACEARGGPSGHQFVVDAQRLVGRGRAMVARY
jgi:hypothetical protein